MAQEILTEEQLKERLNYAEEYKAYLVNKMSVLLYGDFERNQIEDTLSQIKYWYGAIDAYRDALGINPMMALRMEK